jgi:hypothetical protein
MNDRSGPASRAALERQRDRWRLILDDLSSTRSEVLLKGTEAELDAHDRQRAVAQKQHDDVVAQLLRLDAERDKRP